jgi:peptidoglycan/LPS O-acetylase OafA/YrhL
MNWLALWKDAWHANVVGHFWSLCLEEQFYFLWPLVVLIIPSQWLLRSLVFAELAVITGRSWWTFNHGMSYALSLATIARMDGLLFGAACAVAVRQLCFSQRIIKILPWISAFCLGLYLGGRRLAHAGANFNETFNAYYGLPLLGAAFAGIVLISVLTDAESSLLQSGLRWKPLTRFGKYAYGIYVFHVPVFYFMHVFIEDGLGLIRPPTWLRYVAIVTQFSISYGIAALSYNVFEKRFLALKHNFEPKSSQRASNHDVIAAH